MRVADVGALLVPLLCVFVGSGGLSRGRREEGDAPPWPTPLIDGTPGGVEGDGLFEFRNTDFPSGNEELDLIEDELMGVNSSEFGEGGGNRTEVLAASPSTKPPPPPRIPFTSPPIDKGYKARDNFAPRGMEHLYFITNIFLQAVHREKELPDELHALLERELAVPVKFDREQGRRVANDLEDTWDTLLFHYVGLTLLLILGILVAFLTPVVGIVFCCCRCGGKCGGEQHTYDKKGDSCKRVVLGSLLSTLIVLLLLGLVCSFVTNARLDSGVHSLPTELEESIHDSKLYLNNTHTEVKTLFVNNYKELQKALFNKLDRSGELINGNLARVSKAIAITNLTAIAESLGNIKVDLRVIRNTTIQLQEETSNLQKGLRDVASRLNALKESCDNIPQCLELIKKYASNLEINNDFLKLPDVNSKLEEVSMLIDNDIEIEVSRGKRAFDSIARDIQAKVQLSIPDIKTQIKDTGKEMAKIPRDLERKFVTINFDDASDNIQVARHYINEYAMYRFYSFLLICTLLLLIVICFTMGVIFGCCGRRPDEATSCYKTTGASWLMWGVALTFLLSIVIMLSTSTLFLLGSLAELLVCDPLRDPSHSEVFELVEPKVNLESFLGAGEKPELSEVIRKCHLNMSFYQTLDSRSFDPLLYNLTNYKKFLKLDEKIDRIKSEIGQSIDTNVQILSKEAKNQLKALAKSTLAKPGPWDFFTNILEQSVLQIDLLDLAAQLNQTADELPPNYSEIAVNLKNDAIFLEGLRRWLSSIKTNVVLLKTTTLRLREALKFNKTSLREAINDLIEKAEFAQVYLQVNGSHEVSQLVTNFTREFLEDVDHYVEHVRVHFTEHVGKCEPMSQAYNATTGAFCKNILYPFNGYWASVGWCYLLFLPCIALAVALASLYRNTEPYCGTSTESHESMYDAFAERDNIPLTSGCDKKPSSSSSRSRSSRDYDCGGRVTSSYSSEPYSSSAPAHAHASPPRSEFPPPQNDWGEYPPAGGPPRYTSQPSLSPEYERPPPYYYPGPGRNS